MVWQTMDIDFRAPRLNAEGQKTENARATMYLNGRLIYDNVELDTVKGAGGRLGVAEEGPIYLQEHGTAYQFRNIWLVEKTKGKASLGKKGPKREQASEARENGPGQPRKAPGARKPANKGGKATQE